MSSRQVNRLDSSRLSDRHHDYYASERQSGRSVMSKVPDQENIPQGLNESYYRETAAALGMPMDDGSRSHSVPLPTSAVVRYPRSPSISSSRSSSRSYCSVSRDNEHSPGSVNQTRGIIQSNFSQTRAGIGAGIVGAVIGGLVAKQASEAAFRHKQKQTGRPRRHSSETIPRMASTVLGAVAGALGANAVTHRWEDARERNRSQQLTGGNGMTEKMTRPTTIQEDYKIGITQMARDIFLTLMTTTMYTAESGNKMTTTQDDVALKNHSSITTETSHRQLVHHTYNLKHTSSKISISNASFLQYLGSNSYKQLLLVLVALVSSYRQA